MGRLILNDQEYTARPHPKQVVYSVTVGDVAEGYDWMVQDETGVELAPWESPWDRLTAQQQKRYVRAVDNAFGEINQLETIQDALKEARKGCTGGS